MKHSNISVFIPHIGCPMMCSFCNQRTISGTQKAPSGEEVREICREAFTRISDKENCEIAFFGGSFTAIPHDYRIELLESVRDFVGKDKLKGIRISTRPDCIDDDILRELMYYHVTSIELGCQSMHDEVLKLNRRGHDSECVEEASRLIKSYGFELGLQMMTGLYGSSPELDRYTADKILRICPDTVRIYPVVVLEGTELAELYKKGKYDIYGLDEMVSLCSEFMSAFSDKGIRVIKCGLHASEMVEGEMVAGYYHPAFRELCESRIFRNMLEKSLEKYQETSFTVLVNNRSLSKAQGHKRSNIEYFSKKGISLKFIQDMSVAPGDFLIAIDNTKKGSN